MVALPLALGCSSATPSPSESAKLTTKELVQRSKPAIVRITVRVAADVGVGTGFIIDKNGDIVTNLHVIGGADEIEIQRANGDVLPLTHIKAYDIERDLAILSVDTEKPVPALTLANSDQVAAGDPVVAIGNPLGVLDFTVSDGLISSVRELSPTLTVLQISAPISKGSSGGPLFDPRGHVIGVVRALISQGQNLNFGIPSNYLHELIGRDDKLSLSVFNNKLALELAAKAAEQPSARPGQKIARKVPNHPVSLLDNCSEADIANALQAIQAAITSGAPIYNQGNHEGCFRIYEGTALRLERESSCQGVRDALGQGMLRASTMESATLKAWAMRDAFDGLLSVIKRKQDGP